MILQRIGQVSERLGVTNATIRNYLALGDEYFSPMATRKHGKRFTPDDMDQLIKIQGLLGQGLTYAEIPEHLEPAPQVTAYDAFEEPEPEPEPTSSEIAPFEFFQDIMDNLRDQHAREIAAKDDLINELREDKQRLQERLDRPWWKRLFGG